MHRTTFDLIYEQVRVIYSAVTGTELPHRLEMQQSLPFEGPDAVIRRFAELDAFTRLVPPIASRVPPFAFSPQVDVVEKDKELIVELAVPGLTRDELSVESSGNALIVSGVRPGEPPNGHTYRLAEIPRGLFRRVLLLPPDVSAEPRRVELVNGIAKIHLGKVTAAVAKA
jgi:HSP20 family molecular chaperone IbpA